MRSALPFRPAPTLLAAFFLLAGGCGGPPFFAELADPRICVTVPGQVVPAAPAILGTRSVTVSWHGDLDVSTGVSGIDKGGAATGTVEMIELWMDTSMDASGVATAAVAITTDDPADPSGAAQLVIQRATYQRQASDDAKKLVFALEAPAANLLPTLTAHHGILHYQVTFTGTPPTVDWNADVVSCVKTHVTVDLTRL